MTILSKKWPVLIMVAIVSLSVATAHAAKFTFNTSDNQFTPNSNNQGWRSNGDFPDEPHLISDANDSYAVGAYLGVDLRNFFTFDLSALPANHQVTSATLEIQRRYYFGDLISETWKLFDVSTPAAELNNNSSVNLDIFNDLGSGLSYGTFGVSNGSINSLLRISLNTQAFRDIEANAGGFFSIGGRLMSLTHPNERLFSSSGGQFPQGSGIQRLLLKTRGGGSVPEPSTLSVLLVGAAILGGTHRRCRSCAGGEHTTP